MHLYEAAFRGSPDIEGLGGEVAGDGTLKDSQQGLGRLLGSDPQFL